MKKALFVIAALVGLFTIELSAYEFKAGDYVVMEYDGYQMRIDVEKYNKKVNGFSALRLINEEDYYGGGSYVAKVSGIGWASVGTDVHDAMTSEYLGIEYYYPPCPYDGEIEYGDEVGTKTEWRGYLCLDGEEPEDYDRTVWEVVGYEDVSVPYGDFTNAMKVLIKEYYSYDYYDEDLDPYDIAEDDWELSESCSTYEWIVPTVGTVQISDYEYYGEEGPYPTELVSCKINGKTNPEPEEPAGPAELSLNMTGKKIPTSVLSGTETKLQFQVEITNDGGSSCEKGETVDLYFYAENVATAAQRALGSVEGFSISNLAAGKTKKAKGTLVLPSDMEEGTFIIIAVCGDLEAAYYEYITVEEGNVTLSLEVSKYKIPPSIIAGTSSKCSIDLIVTNDGNLSTDKTDTETIEIYAESKTSDYSDELNSVEANIGGMKPGKSKKVKLPVEFPADLPEDDYEIVVYFGDTSLIVTEVSISEPTVEFEIELESSDIPSAIVAGTDVDCELKLNVTNCGNICSEKDEALNIQVIARSVTDSSEQTLVSEDAGVGNFKPGKGKGIKLPVAFPANMAEGSYDIVVSYDGEELAVTTVGISEPYIELTGSTDETDSPPAIFAGQAGGVEIDLEITNNGNDTTAKTQTIDIAVYLKPENGDNTLLETLTGQDIGGLAAGKSTKLKLDADVPATLESGSYQLVVHIDSSNAISENNEDDNWLTIDFEIIIIDSLADIMEPSLSESYDYSALVKGDYFYGSGQATINGVFYEEFEFDDDSDAHDYSLSWEDDGVYFYEYSIGSGYAHYYFSTDDDILLTSNELALKTTIKSTKTGYVEHRVYGLDFDFDATIVSEFEIEKMETVKVNGTTYQAYKINWSFSISGSDILDLTDYGDKAYNYTDTFEQNITYWAVPGVGVVKQTSKGKLKLSINGMGTDNWTFDYTKELIQ